MNASALRGERHEYEGVGAELSFGFFPSGRSMSPMVSPTVKVLAGDALPNTHPLGEGLALDHEAVGC
jgi:hypothetical protein